MNAILTTFANYLKDDVGEGNDVQIDPDALRALRSIVYAQYAEFDRVAWWWHWRYLRDAALMRLATSAELKGINAACREYQQNLLDTVNELGRLWLPLMGRRRVVQSEIPHQAVRQRIADLRDRRTLVVEELVARLLQERR